jgi:hypothetical protein
MPTATPHLYSYFGPGAGGGTIEARVWWNADAHTLRADHAKLGKGSAEMTTKSAPSFPPNFTAAADSATPAGSAASYTFAEPFP